jgi:hypothetical protein
MRVLRQTGEQIGYLPREFAGRLSPEGRKVGGFTQ